MTQEVKRISTLFLMQLKFYCEFVHKSIERCKFLSVFGPKKVMLETRLVFAIQIGWKLGLVFTI